jgi:tetratricopeptide (TPR) repeat protein
MIHSDRRKNLLHLPFWLLVFLSLAHGQSPPPWTEKFQQAVGQLREGNLAAAKRQFEALWKSEPQDFVLFNAIGSALDSTSHHREATEWYQRALSLNPRFVPACNNLGLNYVALGELEKASVQLRRASQLDPTDGRAVYNLGLVHLQMGHFREAVRAFELAHKLRPAERDPLLRLAHSRFKLGQQAEGFLAIEELARLPGDRGESLLLAIRTLNGSGLYRQAVEQSHKAREGGWTSASLLYEEANALFHLAQYKEAIEVLLRAGAENKSDLNYYLLLGSAQALVGDLPNAVKNLQAAVRAAPDQPEPYFRLALTFLQGYRDQDAEEVLSTGLKQIPNSPLLLFGLGTVREVLGDHQRAIDYLRKSVEVKHDQPAVWALLGELYSKLGQYDQAVEAYQTATAQQSSPETAVKYADLLIRLQHFAEAEKLLQEVMRHDQTMGKAYVILGKLYNAQKQYALAERTLRRAIELDPNDVDAHWFLAAALQHLGRREEAQREGAIVAQKKEALRERDRRLQEVLTPLSTDPGKE